MDNSEAVREVAQGLARFVVDLALIDLKDYKAKAKLFRGLEAIAKQSAEIYEADE